MPFGPRTLVDLDTDLSTLVKIPNLAGYYIAESGDVFVVRRLRQFRDRNGYARVNSGRLRAAVHSLIARVFLRPPKTHQTEVRHLDGNPRNNAISNLKWGTRKENAEDMARHGTLKGRKNPNAKLTDRQILYIVRRRNRGETVRSIAAAFDVCKGAIKHILAGRSWSHITRIAG